jgi:lipopolysaccharide transport system ATP-binding protein
MGATRYIEVERGEVLGIIGKNGAGSLLYSRYYQSYSTYNRKHKSRGRIASLLEVGTGFNGEMTGRENIFERYTWNDQKEINQN